MKIVFLTTKLVLDREVTGLYEEIKGKKKEKTWFYQAPDLLTETDNGVQYNLKEMEDLIKAKKEMMDQRKEELLKIVPEYKETPLFSKKKRPLRVRRPRFQAARPKMQKKEEEKEKEKEKGKGKGKSAKASK